jgi:hypothetical protein
MSNMGDTCRKEGWRVCARAMPGWAGKDVHLSHCHPVHPGLGQDLNSTKSWFSHETDCQDRAMWAQGRTVLSRNDRKLAKRVRRGPPTVSG